MNTAVFLAVYLVLLALAIYIPNAIFAVVSEREWRNRMAGIYGAHVVQRLPSMWRVFFTCGTCKR